MNWLNINSSLFRSLRSWFRIFFPFLQLSLFSLFSFLFWVKVCLIFGCQLSSFGFSHLLFNPISLCLNLLLLCFTFFPIVLSDFSHRCVRFDGNSWPWFKSWIIVLWSLSVSRLSFLSNCRWSWVGFFDFFFNDSWAQWRFLNWVFRRPYCDFTCFFSWNKRRDRNFRVLGVNLLCQGYKFCCWLFLIRPSSSFLRIIRLKTFTISV